MDLRRVANKFETTAFDVFNETTLLWETGTLTGKVMPIDRFLSIFHRATRRRSIGISPSSAIPAHHTIREPLTGKAYIMGLIRGDVKDGAYYDRVGILHGVDVLGQVHRKAPVGPANDPGILVDSVIGSHYMDVELRSASESDEGVENFESHFFLTAPYHSDLMPWDFITYEGESYQVQVPYVDSGMRMARVVKRDDPRVDVVFHKKSGTSGYDPATQTVTTGIVDYQISGFFRGFGLADVDGVAVSSGDVQFVVQTDHIGVYPTNQDQLTWRGNKYNIAAVQEDFLSKHYTLHCSL